MVRGCKYNKRLIFIFVLLSEHAPPHRFAVPSPYKQGESAIRIFFFLPMLKYLTYDIVFQEFPDEVTLAVNLSLCPNKCPGCHSSILLGDVGELLDESVLISLTEKYKGEITCVALMGGDNDPAAVQQVLAAVKQHYGGTLKTGWYSGRQELPENFNPAAFDYVKVGPYREALGALKDRTTNQRFYRVESDGSLTDLTFRFWR